jgi:23S rRNA (cytosine1962-C5)-methyltransferase
MEEIRLSKGRARPVWAGHPWVLSGAIGSVTGVPSAGDVVLVKDHDGRPIGPGFFSPRSTIRVRMLAMDPEVKIDEEFFLRRIRAAAALREGLGLPSTETDAYRLIHADGDRLPGVVADRYGATIVVQLTVAGMERRRAEIAAALLELPGVEGVLLDPVANFREIEGLTAEGGLLAGVAPAGEISVKENGVRFLVDPAKGQKTGHFADHRENRATVRRLAESGTALDCFTGTGGFALAAALGGAREVLGLDSSSYALKTAARNAGRNDVADRMSFEKGDVFGLLRKFEKEGRRFHTVIVDPPSMAHRRSELAGALRGYKELNLRALRLVEDGGLFFTASCTGILSREDFDTMLRDAALDAGRHVVVIAESGQAPDHPWPIAVPEARYLKFRACVVSC